MHDTDALIDELLDEGGPSPAFTATVRANLTAMAAAEPEAAAPPLVLVGSPDGTEPSRPAPPARRRTGRAVRWAALALGLAAAAAAVVVAVRPDAAPPRPTVPPSSPASVLDLSGDQALLAAATAAESRPASDGRYWRVRTIQKLTMREKDINDEQVQESWYGKDGSYWGGVRVLSGPHRGRAVVRKGDQPNGGRPFELEDRPFSLAEIRSAPETPEGIRRWALRAASKTASSREYADELADSLLVAGLAQAPLSPRARAAAFRSLVGRSAVEVGGTARDPRGRTGVRFTAGGVQYILDPRTSLLLHQGTREGLPRTSSTTYLEVGWTNEKPTPPRRP
ncbi:hypothetical protein GCM10009678_56950 [Actinomadura kijaniata]|uniref:hypothetical protein n=1 Tax=Actinomadura kijaniata TaxID=46161 RepID=UPI002FEAB9DD